ncbi:MAG: NAD(P)-dependent alcohol dehydrogenase, partial [Bacteroidota bacterium]
IEADIPEPNINEVLVKVEAVGLNPKDILIRKGKFQRLSGKVFPQTIGFEFSGTVEASQHPNYPISSEVFGMINGWKGRCCAEFLAIPINELAKAPTNFKHETLAGIPLAGQTALQAIRDLGQLKPEQNICINGGSGGVGTIAIQIAKALGGKVVSISSKKNTDFCLELGADQTIAYDEVDILKINQTFDVFFDVFGNYSFKKTAPLLNKGGRYITTVPKPEIIKEQALNLFRKKQAKMIVVKSKSEDIQWLARQIMEGNIRPIVDRVYPLEQMKVAQSYIETKRAKGKVIIIM